MRLLLVFACFAATLTAQSMVSSEQKRNPYEGQKSAIQAGEQRFRGGCAACHGPNAEGGRGPKLVNNPDIYRLKDQQLFNIVRTGIPGTSMPPSQMSDEKTWQVVSFIRSLSSPAYRVFVDGNAAHGEDLFYDSAHCDGCHAIRGRGGLLGPDLSDVGAHLTVGQMRDTFDKPDADTDPNFQSITVSLKDGTTLSGVAKADSAYSVDVLDARGKLHLIDKSQVASIKWLNDTELHSKIGKRLGPEGVTDIIAFLAKQVVRPTLDTQVRERGEIH